MLIVDAQIHLWEKGTPSAHHRQEPYSAEQAIAGMDEASVDRAVIHPVLWDPDSNELAVEAVRKYLDRFAIMGWFYLDDPNGRDLVAHWKERPGMLGLRFCAFAVVNYEQAVEPFLKTDRLSDTERAMLMGGACAKAYGWSPKKG